MRIKIVETVSLQIPFRVAGSPVRSSDRMGKTFDVVLVQVQTDAGISGWGEAFSFNLKEATKPIISEILAPKYVGQDVGNIAQLSNDVLRDYRNSKSGPLTFGVSAIDIALWDIAAKTAGLPLYRLLGGAARGDLAAYASLPRYDDRALAAKEATRAVEDGYRGVKLHEIDPSAVRAVREAVGPDIALMVDASSAWSPVEAIRAGNAMASLDLLWLEEPTWPPEDYQALARVGRLTGLPIAAGENAMSVADLRHLLQADAVSYVQPSVLKIGGITEMMKAMALAEAFNVMVAPHSYYLGPGLLAAIHLIAATPSELWLEHARFDLADRLYDEQFGPRGDGRIPVPQGPGLGFEPRAEVLRRYRVG